MLADYTAMTEELMAKVESKIAALSSAAIDVTGYKQVELVFVAPTDTVAAKLKQQFYHPNGSMIVSCERADNSQHLVQLRMSLELKTSVIQSYLWSFGKIAVECGARLQSWDVVL